MRSLMVQGTGSNVGKSLLVAGICRALSNRGLKVAPFKPQNMSNNAAVTVDGGEIGRAQALQARACRLEPMTDMNPVLLKPETETGSQIIVQGKRFATAEAREYSALKPKLMPHVLDSFNRLKSQFDIVIVEGAGSPAEINLRKGDIANMGFARAADIPVLLAGDIDRGGVIAQLVGTDVILDPADRDLISGFVVNKFRGDPSLFDEGYRFIEEKTGWAGFGIVPYFADAWKLPAEDALDIATPKRQGKPHIVCLGLSRIANFDDLDPLSNDPNLQVTVLKAGQIIPTDAALVVLPGSKSTRGDLKFLREQGWDIDIIAHHRRGGYILGICGGYQMLGHDVADPEGIEGPSGTMPGLGLLDVRTTMSQKKALTGVKAVHEVTGEYVTGYEIHIGQTEGHDCQRPFARIDGTAEGAQSKDGRVMGSYLHGLFSNDAFRSAYLGAMDINASSLNYETSIETTLDSLALHIEKYFSMDKLIAVAR
jgi:adenosylcobyric acid synthase